MAVLYRLVVPQKGRPYVPTDEESWHRAFKRAMLLWRQRAVDLCELGAHRFGMHQVQRARNCHPWGVAVTSYRGAVVHCRHQAICPWCMGRAASSLYAAVRRLLREGDALVSVTNADFFGGNVTRGELQLRLGWARKVMEGLALANSKASRAATWNVVAEPPTFHRGHEKDF